MRTMRRLAVLAMACAVTGARASEADHPPPRCEKRAPSRWIDQQGTMLWGTWSGWSSASRTKADDRVSVLVSARLPKALALEGGRLTASGGADVTGMVLEGMASDGKAVEVAICGAQPSAADPDTVLYDLQAWNPISQSWENPCVPTGAAPSPRALAVGGVWDATGAHHDVAGKITFACETGVIGKCAAWGYKPWTHPDVHQACTRMARADYCGDGVSHTRESTFIEYYDALGLSPKATTATALWDPARASFEAAWAPDGATCLARTRTGQPLSAITQECPGRFVARVADLGEGDRCSLDRADAGARAPILRNRIGGRR